MRSFPLTLLTLCAPIALLAGCSAEKSEQAPSQEAATADAGPPSITGTVAPGVAFRYDYAFSMPVKAVSKVQQQHADACARLGPSRCRVTGMAYDQPGEDQVSARLDFLLAPDLAHSFGNAAVDAVEQAEGTLENANVTGENAGDAIKLSQTDSAGIQTEIARIEARLAAAGLTSAERVELRQQVAALREQQRGQAAQRKAKEASIASTPVSFSYSSQGILSGGGTFAKAASASWSSVESLLAFLLLLGGIALPWALLIASALFGWRWLRRFQLRRPEPSPSE